MELDEKEFAHRSWDEILFEKRNQDYGAYTLRKSYGANLSIAVFVTLFTATLVLVVPRIAQRFQSDDHLALTPRKKLVYTELMAPPPIDKPKPPPPNVALPKLQKAIKFVAP